MIEIIALIFLTKEIGILAAQKGLPSGRWKVNCVICWILMEIIGLFIGMFIFGLSNIVSVAMVGLGFAATGYFMVKNYLQNLPDLSDENTVD